MHIISFKALKNFFTKDPNSRVALQDWHRQVNKAEWKNSADVLNTFGTAENVGNKRYVFNVKGNHYRIVGLIKFRIRTVFIRWVGNHKDYDKLKDIQNL